MLWSKDLHSQLALLIKAVPEPIPALPIILIPFYCILFNNNIKHNLRGALNTAHTLLLTSTLETLRRYIFYYLPDKKHHFYITI